MNRRVLVAIVVAAAVLPLAGCIGLEWLFFEQPVHVAVRMVLPDSGAVKAKTVIEDETDVAVNISADVGGLDGNYDITLDDPEGGTFGSLSGTGTVKKDRFVTLKDKESEALFAAVDALLVKAFGGESVTVTKAKAKVKANQEPGGVAANFTLTISFAGTVDTGPNAGATIKGKITSEGRQTAGG